MPVKKNDPTLPSCETIVQDGVGMRIKGIVNGRLANTRCKVRNIADPQGNVVRYNKQNLPKFKQKTNRLDKRVSISLAMNTADEHVSMIYDTGVMVTTMFTADARHLGIIHPDGTSDFRNQPSVIVGVGGEQRTVEYDDVPLVLDETEEVAFGKVDVYDDSFPLLGINHIKQFKRYRLKLK